MTKSSFGIVYGYSESKLNIYERISDAIKKFYIRTGKIPKRIIVHSQYSDVLHTVTSTEFDIIESKYDEGRYKILLQTDARSDLLLDDIWVLFPEEDEHE